MKKLWITGLAVVFAFGVRAETVTNNLDVQGGFIYNHGAINPADVGLTFTNAGVRDVTVSAGQLSGVDPETGAVITNSANLLPLKAQSLTAVSNIVAGGSFIGDGSGLTNVNVSSLNGTISASSLPTSGTWNAAGVTVSNLTVNSVAGNVAAMTNLMLNSEVLATVISNLQQQTAAVYASGSSVTVQITDNEATNGLRLIAAYAQAETLSPSETNRVAVIVPPGRYDLGAAGLQMDTPYIDLIGQTTDRAAQYLYGAPGENTGVIKQTADNVRIENLTLYNQSDCFMGDASDPAAYFPTVPGSNTVMRNCEFASVGWSMRLSVKYAGSYEQCVAGRGAFGGNGGYGSYGGAASGMFTDCQGGDGSFGSDNGGIANGAFINCRGGDGSFAGSVGYGCGTASGTFISCQGGSLSFAGDCGAVSGTFISCRGGEASFGGCGGAITTNAVLVNCTAGTESFGAFNMTADSFNYNASGHHFAGGPLTGDGSGLTNLPVQAQVNALVAAISNSPAASITTNNIASWNSGGVLAASVQVSTNAVSIATNLAVQGIISGSGAGLNSVAAGGSNGELQFNSSGILAGNTNYFIHPTEHKLAARSQNGNIFRAYNSETIADTNLIYSLRNEQGISVLRLRQNGQDTIRLSGDGNAFIKGNLQLNGQLIADGFGITNLNASYISGTIPVESIPLASTNSSGLLTAADKQKLDTILVSTNGISFDDSVYLARDGSRAMTGNLDLNGNKIANLADAASDTDAASQGRVKTMMQQVPEYGDLSMGEFTSQVATPDRPVPTVIHTEDIANNAVTLDKMDQIPGHTVVGNMTNGYATPTPIEVKDEDDMASNSNTGIPTQQSVKSYVDSTSDTVAKSYAMKYSGVVVRTGTIPSTWQDLNLSGVVGTNRAFVYLRFDNPVGAAYCAACVRENGTTKDVYSYNLGAGTLSGNANADMQFELTTVTDESGVIEIQAPSYCGATNTTIKVILYQVLQ